MYKDIIIFQENGLFGAKDQTGTVIIPPQYMEMRPFSNGYSLVRDKSYRYSYVNEKNIPLFPFGTYAWCESFICGLARVMKDDKWGIINTIGALVVPMKYSKINCLNDKNLLSVNALTQDKKMGKINLEDIIKDNILDGLIYHRTISVDEFRKIMGISRIIVKASRATGKSWFVYGCNTGKVAAKGIPKHPLLSLVTNANGRTFWVLHEAEQTGSTHLDELTVEFKKPNQQCYSNEPDYEYYYSGYDSEYMSAYDNLYYNETLDLDQQSPEFWENF